MATKAHEDAAHSEESEHLLARFGASVLPPFLANRDWIRGGAVTQFDVLNSVVAITVINSLMYQLVCV